MTATMNKSSDLDIHQVFQGYQIRTTFLGNEVWFVGIDVAKALEYKKPADAIRKHIDEDEKGVSILETPGGKQELVIITEIGLYSLILRSKQHNAKAFQKWAKQLIQRYRKGDLSLANEVVERNGGKDQEGLTKLNEQTLLFADEDHAKFMALRAHSIAGRKDYTKKLVEHGCEGKSIAISTNKIYEGILGKTAQAAKTAKGLRKRDSLRDNLSFKELSAVLFAEAIASEKLEQEQIAEAQKCITISQQAGQRVGSVMYECR